MKILARFVFLSCCVLLSSWAGAQLIPLSGEGWKAQLDENATWKDDKLYLPHHLPSDLSSLPQNAPTEGWAALEKGGRSVSVPMTMDEYFLGGINTKTYAGVSWVWRDVVAPADLDKKIVFLHIARARMRAEVYINQQLAAYDVVGETPFRFDVTPYIKAGQRNQIAIRLTNPGGRRGWSDMDPLVWGEHIYLGSSRHFTTLGDVFLDIKDQVYIDDLFIKNILPAKAKRVQVQVDIVNKHSEPVQAYLPIAVQYSKDGQCIAQLAQDVMLQSGLNKLSFEMQLDEAKLWSPQTPELYQMKAQILTERGQDERVETFGVRTFEVKMGSSGGKNYYLNGDRFSFKTALDWGFYTPTGDYATPELAERSVDAALAMGLNGLSFHRAIGDPLIMKYADEKGLCIHEEQGGFYSYDLFGRVAKGENEGFSAEQIKEKIRRMVLRDRNHPSLIVYCLSNENNTFSTVREDAMKLINALDDSRYIVNTSGDTTTPIPRLLGANESDYIFNPDEAWTAILPAGSDATPNIKPYESKIGFDNADLHTAMNRGARYVDDDFYQNIHRNESFVDYIYFLGEVNSVTGPDNWYKTYRDIQASAKPGYDTNIYQLNHDKIADAFDRWQLAGAGSGNIKQPEDVSIQAGRGMMYIHARHAQSIMCNNTAEGYAINGWTPGPQSEGNAEDWASGVLDESRNIKGPADSYTYWTRDLQIALARKNGKYFKPGEPVQMESHLVNQGRLSKGSYKLVYTICDGDAKDCGFREEKLVEVLGGDEFAKPLGELSFTPSLDWKAGYITVNAALYLDDKLVATGAEQVLLQNRGSYQAQLNDVVIDVRGWNAAQQALNEAGARVLSGNESLLQQDRKPQFILVGDMSAQGMSSNSINNWGQMEEILLQVQQGATLIMRFDPYWANAFYEKGILSEKISEWGGAQTPEWLGNGWAYLDHYIGYQSLANKGTIGTNSWEVPQDPYGFYPFASKYPLKAYGLYMCRPWTSRNPAMGYRVKELQPTLAVILGAIQYGKGQIILHPCYHVDENTAFTDMLFFNMILMNK